MSSIYVPSKIVDINGLTEALANKQDLLAALGARRFFPPDTSNLISWHSPRNGAYTDTGRTTLAFTDGDAIAGYADLSGNATDASQSTSGDRPILKLGANGINGKPALDFSGGKSLVTGSFLGSATDTAFTAYFVVKIPETGGLSVFAANGSTYFGAVPDNGTITVTVAPGQQQPAYRRIDPVLVICVVYDGAHLTVDVNRRNVGIYAETGNLGLSGALTLGNYSSGGFPWSGLLGDSFMYKVAHDLTMRRYIQGGLAVEYGALPPNLIADGNSITAGYNLSPGYDWPTILRKILGTAWQSDNFGVAGQLTADLISDEATQVLPCYDSLRPRNILFINEVTNSLIAGLTGAQVWTQHQTYLTAAKTPGFTTVLCLPTDADASVAGAGFNIQRQAFRDLALANPGAYDVLVDATADPFIGVAGSSSNTTFFQEDKLHLLAPGQQRFAFISASALHTAGVF